MSSPLNQPVAVETPRSDAARPRLDSLDLLRGVAILGIFLMNSQGMSMPTPAYFNPIAYDPAYYASPETYTGLSRLNSAVWVIIHVVADTKFITIFSMLFGAGILLQGERLEGRGVSPTAVHCLRMAVLLIFGLIHAHVFWYGDVLFNYAVLGLLLFPLRRLPATRLVVAGVCLVAMATLFSWANQPPVASSLVRWVGEGTARLTESNTGVDFEYAAYTGSWIQQARSRSWVALDNETFTFLSWTLWRCGGAMLIGMGLLRSRFFHGEWGRKSYGAVAALAIPTGWAITGLGVVYNQSHGWWDGAYPDFIGLQFNYWGSLVGAVGYLALGTAVVLRLLEPGAWLLRKLCAAIRAVGKTALSNYLLQSVIGTTIFYGHGFGYYGSVSRAQLVLIVLGVWTFQLIGSVLWTRRFKQGPLEWVWHKMVYGCLSPRNAFQPRMDTNPHE